MPVDLRTCKPGTRLLSKHGMVLTYVGPIHGPYPHEVRYPDGSRGTRTDDGHAYRLNRKPEDHDIVEILGDPV